MLGVETGDIDFSIEEGKVAFCLGDLFFDSTFV